MRHKLQKGFSVSVFCKGEKDRRSFMMPGNSTATAGFELYDSRNPVQVSSIQSVLEDLLTRCCLNDDPSENWLDKTNIISFWDASLR
ncbi:hypothetical protein ACOSQ2_018513 [Xanthoceras sorbifolium]